MTYLREKRKLAELRAKTDQQLVEYLSAQLDRALVFAEAGEFLMHAEKIYGEVRHLLPLVRNANPVEWARLAARLNDLREMLDAYQVSHCVA